MDYRWDFSVVWEARWALAHGLWISVLLTTISAVAGTILSLPLTLGLLHREPVVRFFVTTFVEVARALPVLVVLVWAYYVIPALTGIGFSAFWTAVLVLSVNMCGFGADILRGGILAIPREHIDAARALGMTRFMVLRRVIIPETFRRSIPGLTAVYIALFKASTLASAIAVYELLHTANTIILDRFRPLEVYTAVACIYLAIILPATYFIKRIEKHPWFRVSAD